MHAPIDITAALTGSTALAAAELRLHIGGRFTGVAVVPDGKWPAMWRVRATDGRLSDMVNLPRAKNAAVANARPRGLGGNEAVRWDRRETPADAPPARFSRWVGTRTRPWRFGSAMARVEQP